MSTEISHSTGYTVGYHCCLCRHWTERKSGMGVCGKNLNTWTARDFSCPKWKIKKTHENLIVTGTENSGIPIMEFNREASSETT